MLEGGQGKEEEREGRSEATDRRGQETKQTDSGEEIEGKRGTGR